MKFTISIKNASVDRVVEADSYETVGEFVDFRKSVYGPTAPVFRIRADSVKTITMTD